MQSSAQHIAELAAVLDENETEDGRMLSDDNDFQLRLLGGSTSQSSLRISSMMFDPSVLHLST